jgi:hypothetical protein
MYLIRFYLTAADSNFLAIVPLLKEEKKTVRNLQAIWWFRIRMQAASMDTDTGSKKQDH